MREIFVPLGTGLRYHALEWGADDPTLDHTVVLLHGFLDNAWGWEATAEAGLAGRFHLIAPDLRGHGDSDRVGAGGYYHFMDYVADVAELVRLCGRRLVSLVGHSMGGGVAAYYAGTFPERVHRLALLEGTGPPDQPMEPARVAAWIRAWTGIAARPPRSHATVEDAARRLRANDPRLDPALARRLAEKGTAPTPDGRLRFKHDPLHTTVGPYGFQTDIAARFWTKITCPTLLVEAEHSLFRHPPEEAARRHGFFKDARHAVLPGAAHMMQRHAPAGLAALLVEFLRSP